MSDLELKFETSPKVSRKNFSRNNTGKRRAADFYETPYSMTKQLLEVEGFGGEDILEPSAGDGAIVRVLVDAGYNVWANDLNREPGVDFLGRQWVADNVVTNPPYALSTDFIIHAKRFAKWKIALLLPTDYLHGKERWDLIFQDQKFPLARVWVFVRRPMLGDPLREDGKYRTGMQTYAWFVWERFHRGPAQLGWIDNSEFVLRQGDV